MLSGDRRPSPTPRQRAWDAPPLTPAGGSPGAPSGRHAATARFWTPLRVVLLLATIALAACWLAKSPCVQTYVDDGGTVQLDWRDSRQYAAMCYSDTVPLYGAERLDTGGFVYATSWVEDEGKPNEQVRYEQYPVLTGLFQWANARLTAGWVAIGLPAVVPVIVYFHITVVWLALAWLVTIWTTVQLAGTRRWDVVVAAVSPLVVVHIFTNYDAIATACTAGAMLAWARRRPGLAGVLIGLGVAAKLYPLVLLGPLLVLCLRAGRLDTWLRTAAAAAAAWGAVNLPIALLYPAGWYEVFRFNNQRGANLETLYFAVAHFSGWAGFDGPLKPGQVPETLNLVTVVLFGLCCLAIAVVALTAPTRPRVAQLAFLVVVALLLTNKVWSPQYSLWLVPLAVLALPRWRVLLVWMTVDALLWAPLMYYFLGEDNGGLPAEWFLVVVLLRDALLVTLCILVVRDIYRPQHDRVRAGGVDDPIGGVLDGAPDRFVPRRGKPEPDQASMITRSDDHELSVAPRSGHDDVRS